MQLDTVLPGPYGAQHGEVHLFLRKLVLLFAGEIGRESGVWFLWFLRFGRVCHAAVG